MSDQRNRALVNLKGVGRTQIFHKTFDVHILLMSVSSSGPKTIQAPNLTFEFWGHPKIHTWNFIQKELV